MAGGVAGAVAVKFVLTCGWAYSSVGGEPGVSIKYGGWGNRDSEIVDEPVWVPFEDNLSADVKEVVWSGERRGRATLNGSSGKLFTSLGMALELLGRFEVMESNGDGGFGRRLIGFQVATFGRREKSKTSVPVDQELSEPELERLYGPADCDLTDCS